MPSKSSNAAYLHAAEQRRVWLTYMLNQGKNFGRGLPRDEGALGPDPSWSAQENYFRTQRAAFEYPLRRGELFYLDAEACEVLQQTVDSVNYDPTLRAEWLPTPGGFVYFERPSELSSLRTPPPNLKKALRFRALGWSCLQFHREQSIDTAHVAVADNPTDTQVTMWATMCEFGDVFLPISFLSWEVGESLERCIAEKDRQADPLDRYIDNSRHELRYAAAFLVLLGAGALMQTTVALQLDNAATEWNKQLELSDSMQVVSRAGKP